MTSSPAHSLLCPVLIGREAHLETIEYTLSQAKLGQGQTILIAGEAGWGKTRLTAEAKSRAVEQEWHCLQGDCFENERSLPYAPIGEILQSLEYTPAHLTPLLSRTGNPASFDRHQLYFELATFLAEIAASQPLLIIVEDLHWCDDASLEVLLYLSRKMTNSPVLFLVTFRDNEIQPSLAHYLSQLDRERRAREIKLAPLSQADTSLMVQTIFNQNRPTRAEFISVFYPLTEGNPFFIEEMLKSMLMAGDIVVSDDGIWAGGSLNDLHIPRSVQDSVRQRSQQLSPDAQQVLTLASVAGRDFDFDLLQKLTGQDETTLLKLLKELLAAQLIIEISADRFAFRHALTREAVYLSLLARERRQLHADIAATLEKLSDNSDTRLGDLAYHFYLGENWDKTLAYARRAGDRAQAVHAYAAAINHYSHALEAASQIAPAGVGRLCYQRGYVQMLADHFDAAQKDLLKALNEAHTQADRHLEWETIQALGYLWVDRDYSRAGEYFQQAQSLARELNDLKLVAASLNTVGNWQMNQGHPFAGLRNHHEALAISQSLDDTLGVAQALDYLGIASLHCGQIPQGRSYYDQVLPMWDTLKYPRGSFNAYSSLAFAADYDFEMDDQPVDLAIECGEKSIQLSHQYAWRSSESLALISTGLALRQHGDAARALTMLQQGLEIADEIEHTKFKAAAHGALGEVYLDILAFPSARQHLKIALNLARQTHSAVRIFRAIAYLAEAYIRQGEFEQAKTLLDGVLDVDSPMQGILLRMLWGVRIELALAQGDGRVALEWLEQMIATTENLSVAPTETEEEPASVNLRVVPRLWYLRGQALIALNRFSEAEQDLQVALTTAIQQSRQWQVWRIYRELAFVRIAQKQLDTAKESLDLARQGIEVVAAGLREACSDLACDFTHTALSSLPELPSTSAEQQLKQQFGGLTAREREVAAFVAQGKTNHEIADELVLSERTAERHIANIMKKLGFNTRAQIAAWVVENGLDYTQT